MDGASATSRMAVGLTFDVGREDGGITGRLPLALETQHKAAAIKRRSNAMGARWCVPFNFSSSISSSLALLSRLFLAVIERIVSRIQVLIMSIILMQELDKSASGAQPCCCRI